MNAIAEESIPPRSASTWVSIGGCVVAWLLPWSASAARSVHEQAAADPQGAVEVVDVAGSIDVRGWDRPEIDVAGTADDGVERVEITRSGANASIRVVTRDGISWGRGGHEARLVIRVPGRCPLSVNLVSADLTLEDLQGAVKVHTVSGDVSGDVGGDLRAGTVTGSMQLRAPAANLIEVNSISGDIHVSGNGGEVVITTISGGATVDLGAVRRGRFKSVSGDVRAQLALVAGGQVEGESVSGNITFGFAGTPGADIDVRSLSGDIVNCFGPKPVQARYGPGSHLEFKSGEGGGRVQIETKSGNVQLCDKHALR